MDSYLTVRNWSEFQHYKDRSPPWIKLHRDLLRDYEFSCLQDASKLLLIELWLLASQLDNKIPNDPKWLARQLPYNGEIELKPLIDMGFIILVQDASKPLAECKQSAIGETETETETEVMSDSIESDAFEEIWKARPERPNQSKAKTKKAYNARIKEGIPHADLLSGLIRYNAYSKAEGTAPQFIKQLSTFLNADKHWNEAWEISEKVPPIEDTAAILRCAQEKGVNLPDNCTAFDARKIIAKEARMQL